MKTRNQCKVCGASGKIKTPQNGHFSHRKLVVEKNKTPYMKTVISLKSNQVCDCPFCIPDKYPKKNKKQENK